MHPFTTVFLAALALTTAFKLYLAYRHAGYVRKHRAQVPESFSAEVSLAAHQKAADYTCAKTRFGAFGTVVDALVLLLFTLGGGLAAAEQIVAGVLGPGIARGVALVALVAILAALVDLPLSLYRTFRIEARFGFNTMTAKLFFIDVLKSALVSMLLGLPLLALILWLMDQAGSRWWLYAWAVWVTFNLAVIAIYPTVIAPLFNRFSPMQDDTLKARIERLLSRCGFRAQGLFVMDGSRRSTHGNAYFTGFGRSKRIVFFDTLLARLNHAEIEAVLAHELGHFKHKHVLKRMLWLFSLSLGLFWLLGELMLTDWFYYALGVPTPSTAMALLLFFLTMPVFTFLLQPLAGLYSRRHEFEADHYAAHNASGVDLKRALIKLYKDNASTLTPDPWHSAFYDSHPPAAERVAHLELATQGA
jgi:STE24 endopeptidase